MGTNINSNLKPENKALQNKKKVVLIIELIIAILGVFGIGLIVKNNVFGDNNIQINNENPQTLNSPSCIGDNCQANYYGWESKSPGAGEAEYQLGISSLNRREYNDAQTYFTEAIRLGEHVSGSWFGLAEIAFHNGNYPTAILDYNYASDDCGMYYETVSGEVIPACWDIYLGMANSLHALYRDSEAQIWMSKVPEYYIKERYNLTN